MTNSQSGIGNQKYTFRTPYTQKRGWREDLTNQMLCFFGASRNTFLRPKMQKTSGWHRPKCFVRLLKSTSFCVIYYILVTN